MPGGRRTSFHGGRPNVSEPPIDADVRREIHAHVRLAADDLVAQGWTEDDALLEARRRLGDEREVRRRSEREVRRRDARIRRTRVWEGMMQDVRYAFRSLSRSPVFTLIALVTLALGIGANATIFSVVEGILLRPLPYPEADRLVRIWEQNQSGGTMDFSTPSFLDVQRDATSLEAAAAVRPATLTVVGGSEPARVSSAFVSHGFWDVFPVRAAEGRLTTWDDHVEGAPPVVVVGEDLAARLFGGSAEAVGQGFETAGVRATIVGVVTRGFAYPAGAELWITREPFGTNTSRTSHSDDVVARLAAAASIDAARDEVDGIVRRGAGLAVDQDPAYLPTGSIMRSLREAETGDVRQPLMLLWAAAGFVLLVACTNLASTLLARGTSRKREVAVRVSLGATRGRIVRQLLTESGILSLAGAVAGVGVAWLMLRVMQPLGAGSLPRLDEVQLSGTVLLFALGVSVVTAIAFGLFPALRVAPDRTASVLRTAQTGGQQDMRIWNVLISAEVALALVLLIGSGLMIRSFAEITSQDPGVDARDVVTSPATLAGPEYGDFNLRVRFWEDQVAALARSPGVEAAGIMTVAPVQGFIPTGRISIDLPENYIDSPIYVTASEGAFDALDIPLLAGRMFGPEDHADAPHVVVVNEAFVDAFSANRDAIGRRVTGGGMDSFWNADPPVFAEIVGVVGDVRHRSFTDDPRPAVYWNFRQRPSRMGSVVLFAEATDAVEPISLVPELRSTLRTAEPDIALAFASLQSRFGESVRARTFVLVVLGLFAGLAVVLAGVGIYGVVSYTTAQRTREVGIRMALGADAGGVRALIVRQAMLPVGIGLLFGTIGSLWLTSHIETLLFGVSPIDPLTFVVVPTVLAVIAATASLIPAARSSRVSPTVAIRSD